MEETNQLFVDLHGRVGRLEQNFGGLKDAQQKAITEMALIQKDIGYIRTAQDRVSQGINRILWAIAISVVGAVVTFISTGGLASLPQ